MVSVKNFTKLLLIKCSNHLTIYDGTFVNFIYG